jgi:hydrogenase nickel incorporation protein HypA/HybF
MAAPLLADYPLNYGNTLAVHEASIALAILEEVCERSAADGIEKVAAVHVQVGVLSSVVPQALTFAWDVATDGTLADGSQLRIERIPLTIRCASCSQERVIEESVLPICPVCGTSSSEIVRGRELNVSAMEVVYAAAPGRRPAEHSSEEHYARA